MKNIKTIKKYLKEEIYNLGSREGLDVLVAYDLGGKKRISEAKYNKILDELIDILKNIKISPLGEIDGVMRYLIKVGEFEVDVWGKKEAVEAYKALKDKLNKIKKLKKGVKGL